MSFTLLDAVAERIGRPTLARALQRLGTTPDDFAPEVFERALNAYVAEMEAWITRNQARTDQMEAASRMSDQVPHDAHEVPLYELARSGVIDIGEFHDGMATLVRIQDEEAADPFPEDADISQLLKALQEMYHVSQIEQESPVEVTSRGDGAAG